MTHRLERRGTHRRIGFTLVLGAVMLASVIVFATGVAWAQEDCPGCMATQSQVMSMIRQALKPVQDKVSQLETTAAQQKARLDQEDARISQVDGRVTQVDGKVTQVDGRVTQVDGKVTQLDQRQGQLAAQLTETRVVADAAALKAVANEERLTKALANRFRRELVSIASLRFAPNQHTLLPIHQDALRAVLTVLEENPTHTADIVGFTDGEGAKGHNLNLSWLREEAVRRFLVERGRVLNRLAFIGLGEDLTAGDKNHPMARARDRQVAILIYRAAQ